MTILEEKIKLLKKALICSGMLSFALNEQLHIMQITDESESTDELESNLDELSEFCLSIYSQFIAEANEINQEYKKTQKRQNTQ